MRTPPPPEVVTGASAVTRTPPTRRDHTVFRENRHLPELNKRFSGGIAILERAVKSSLRAGGGAVFNASAHLF